MVGRYAAAKLREQSGLADATNAGDIEYTHTGAEGAQRFDKRLDHGFPIDKGSPGGTRPKSWR